MINWEKILPKKFGSDTGDGYSDGYDKAIDDCLSALKSMSVMGEEELKKHFLSSLSSQNSTPSRLYIAVISNIANQALTKEVRPTFDGQ